MEHGVVAGNSISIPLRDLPSINTCSLHFDKLKVSESLANELPFLDIPSCKGI